MVRSLLVTMASAAALAVLLPTAPTIAHPHVWVTIKTDILYDTDGKVTGVRHHWTFDEFFSAFATQGLDRNGDGKLEGEELTALAEENVSSLKEFDYFTHAKADGEKATLMDPSKDYFLVHDNGLLTLHFTLRLDKPVDPRKTKFHYSVYDPTFYVDFAYAAAEESPVKQVAHAPSQCRAELSYLPQTPQSTALSEAFYQGLGSGSDFGKQFARDVSIICNAQ